MRRAAIGVTALSVLFVPAALAADAVEDFPGSQFTIERTLELGAAFTASKGQIIYAEKSFGTPGTFLVDPMPAGDWPVLVDTDVELSPSNFKGSRALTWVGSPNGKVELLDVYCSRKYGEITKIGREEWRSTICFKDVEGDGEFDRIYIAHARVSSYFGLDPDRPFKMTNGIESISPDPKEITPTRYAKRLAEPDAGKEAVVELRYDGVKDDKLEFTILSREADAATPIYERQIEAARPGGMPVELVIEHPILSSPGFRQAMGHDRPPLPPGTKDRREPPRPIPTMTISLTKADAKTASGTIVAGYPDWVWHRPATCKGEVSPTREGAFPPRSCERARWRDGRTIVDMGPRRPDGAKTTTTSSDSSKP